MIAHYYEQAHARFTVERLSRIKGLRVVVPQGAMYVMVRMLFGRFHVCSLIFRIIASVEAGFVELLH